MTRTVAGQFVFWCYAIGLAYWIVAAFWTKPTVERRAWWATWPTRSAAVALVIWLMIRHRARLPAGPKLWSYTPAIGTAAAIVTGAGLVFLLWARITLAGNWSADVVLKQGHELIERGPYRYVRHPIYSAFILMAIGGVLLWGTASAAAVLVVLPVVLWIKLSQEERLLTKHFPDTYPAYKARVKGLVPFVL